MATFTLISPYSIHHTAVILIWYQKVSAHWKTGSENDQKKFVFLPAGKIKCHSSSFAYEIFMKRKTLLFLIFYAKQVPKKITFCTNWTNMSKPARITFAKHPAKVFALSHWLMSNICAKQAVKLSFVQVQLICWCSG